MASSAALSLTTLLAIFLAISTGPHAEAAISCSSVLSSLSSCIGYIRSGGPVPGGCCDGVKALNNAAKTTPDLQATCRCIVSLVPSVRGRADLVNSLPSKCGVNIPYKYPPSLDCSKIVR